MVSRGLGQIKPNCTQVQTPQSVFTYVKPVESTFTFSRPEEAHPNKIRANKHPEELFTSQHRHEHKRSQCGIQLKDSGLKHALWLQLMSSL